MSSVAMESRKQAASRPRPPLPRPASTSCSRTSARSRLTIFIASRASFVGRHVLLGQPAVADEVGDALGEGEGPGEGLRVSSDGFVHEPPVAAHGGDLQVSFPAQGDVELQLAGIVIDDVKTAPGKRAGKFVTTLRVRRVDGQLVCLQLAKGRRMLGRTWRPVTAWRAGEEESDEERALHDPVLRRRRRDVNALKERELLSFSGTAKRVGRLPAPEAFVEAQPPHRLIEERARRL